MALTVVLLVLGLLLLASVAGLVGDLRSDGYGAGHTSGEGLHWTHRALPDRAYAGPGPR